MEIGAFDDTKPQMLEPGFIFSHHFFSLRSVLDLNFFQQN
jgi:hypothetical protein